MRSGFAFGVAAVFVPLLDADEQPKAEMTKEAAMKVRMKALIPLLSGWIEHLTYDGGACRRPLTRKYPLGPDDDRTASIFRCHAEESCRQTAITRIDLNGIEIGT